MHLYDYYRSSASYRVRLALEHKQLAYNCIPIHLVRDGGEQHHAKYRELNPQGLVPSLVDDYDNTLSQSLAIIEYLEELHPTPALLPTLPLERAKVRQVAYAIACEVHPLNNLRVLQYLQQQLEVSEEQKTAWYQHWLAQTLPAVEQWLNDADHGQPYCFAEFSLADCCLIPQIYNAQRFDFSLEAFPRITAIYEHALTMPLVQQAAPAPTP